MKTVAKLGAAPEAPPALEEATTLESSSAEPSSPAAPATAACEAMAASASKVAAIPAASAAVNPKKVLLVDTQLTTIKQIALKVSALTAGDFESLATDGEVVMHFLSGGQATSGIARQSRRILCSRGGYGII